MKNPSVLNDKATDAAIAAVDPATPFGAGGAALSRRSADRVVECLKAYGVKWVFGVPGAKIDPVYDSLVDDGPELIVCRHEQNAAFMAAAVGRLSGRPGVVLVTSGPGTSNLATGLAVTPGAGGWPGIPGC